MTGRRVYRKPVHHACSPGHEWAECITIPSFESDESDSYLDGDVWQCDDCGRQWTRRVRWDSDGWIPESNRKFRKRQSRGRLVEGEGFLASSVPVGGSPPPPFHGLIGDTEPGANPPDIDFETSSDIPTVEHRAWP